MPSRVTQYEQKSAPVVDRYIGSDRARRQTQAKYADQCAARVR